jgi:DNA-binding response OmpR family regulator
LKVLLVEDETVPTLPIARALIEAGHSVERCANGGEAAARETTFDAVVMVAKNASALGRLRIGELELDWIARRASMAGASLALTSREFALLLHLAQRPGKIASREELMAHVWEAGEAPASNSVEVHLSRLRDKLGDHASMIETVRGAGYRLKLVAR